MLECILFVTFGCLLISVHILHDKLSWSCLQEFFKVYIYIHILFFLFFIKSPSYSSSECLQLVESAKGEESSNAAVSTNDQTTNGSSTSSKTSDTDDAAKERQRLEENYKDANLALRRHGSKQFMSAFWRMVAMDDPVRS